MLSIPLVILCTLSSLRLEVISTLGNGYMWVWVLEIRSLLLSLWRLLRMLSALLLARLLRWTLWVLFVVVDWVDSFWDSFSRERVSYGEGMVHEAWGEWYCMCMSDSCRTLMSWRVWWTRLLMISSARRLSTKCDDCVCLLIVLCLWWFELYGFKRYLYSHTITTNTAKLLIAVPTGFVLCLSSAWTSCLFPHCSARYRNPPNTA